MSQPERTCELCGILARELCSHSRIRINGGKTQIWNRGGFISPGHDALLAIARQDDPDAQIWFGDHAAPESERGIRVLGTTLGSNAFVRAQLQAIGESHELLLSRIPAIQDLQSAWPSLLCSNPCHVLCTGVSSRAFRPVCPCMTLVCGNVSAQQSPTPFGRVGVAECFSHDPCCLLGQLGRLFEQFGRDTLPRPWYKPSIRPRGQLSTWLVHAAVPRWLQKGLRAHFGISSSKDCAFNSLRLTRWNQVFSLTDGSFSLQRLLNSASAQLFRVLLLRLVFWPG